MDNSKNANENSAAGSPANKPTTETALAASTDLPDEKQESTTTSKQADQSTQIYNIRAEFPLDAQSAHDTFNVPIAIRTLLEKFFTAAPGLRVSAQDQTGFISSTTQLPTDEDKFKNYFPTSTIESKSGAIKIITLFTIQSNIPFEQLKSTGNINGYLQDQNVYIYWHPYKTIALTKIGAFFHISPTYTDRRSFLPKARAHVLKWLQCQTPTEGQQFEDTTGLDLKNNDIPIFELSNKRQIYHTSKTTDADGKHKEERMQTIALEVTCETLHAKRMSTLLTEATIQYQHGIGLYVSYTLQRSQPKVFTEAIRSQNIFLHTTTAKQIYGLHPKILHGRRVHGMSGDNTPQQALTVYQTILQQKGTVEGIPLVHAVEETRNTAQNSQYRLVFNDKNKAAISTLISESIPNWCGEIDEFSQYKDAYGTFKPQEPASDRTKQHAKALQTAIASTLNQNTQNHPKTKFRKPPAQSKPRRHVQVIFHVQPIYHGKTTSPWAAVKPAAKANQQNRSP